jgi:hypothetical protein
MEMRAVALRHGDPRATGLFHPKLHGSGVFEVVTATPRAERKDIGALSAVTCLARSPAVTSTR